MSTWPKLMLGLPAGSKSVEARNFCLPASGSRRAAHRVRCYEVCRSRTIGRWSRRRNSVRPRRRQVRAPSRVRTDRPKTGLTTATSAPDRSKTWVPGRRPPPDRVPVSRNYGSAALSATSCRSSGQPARKTQLPLLTRAHVETVGVQPFRRSYPAAARCRPRSTASQRPRIPRPRNG